MKILVTGAGGMLAADLLPELRRRGHDVVACARAELDVTDPAQVRAQLDEAAPEVVIQCAAYTAVDAAEQDEEMAHRVNALGTEHLADWCHKRGALLVYPSTDYAFDGDSSRPYAPEDPTNPLNAYGRSKVAGEGAAARAGRHLVIRTSWLYGAGGPNFVTTISRLAGERPVLQVVDDQVGRPTWARSLSETIAELVERGALGMFHATDGGTPTTWYGFAQEVLALQKLGAHLEPVPTSAFPRPARRPSFSVLDCAKTEQLVGRPMVPWPEALRLYLQACD